MTSSINICFMIGELGRGGQERQMLNLLAELVKFEINVSLIIWNYSDSMEGYVISENLSNIKILRLRTQGVLSKVIESTKFVKINKSTVIQTFTFHLNLYSSIIARFSNTIAIGAIRNQLQLMRGTHGFFSFWGCSVLPIKKISNNRDFMKGMDNWLTRLLFRDTEVIPNHLNVELFKTNFPPPSETIVSCSIGRLYSEKSLDVLIEAISIIANSGVAIRHFHAGKGSEETALRALVSKRQLADVFYFVGEIDNISDFLFDKHLLVHSSKFEGFPNVLMEAMACGKPIVSTDCGDARYIIENGRNGYIVKIGDYDAIAEKILVISTSLEKRLQFASASRKIACEMFDSRILLNSYLDYYKKNSI